MTPTPPANESSPAAGIAAWRILFRMLAGFLALFSFAYWAAAGWNRGWTKTQIAVTKIEEVTGIPEITYQDHFAPGVELLSLAFFLCAGLFALTFIRRRKSA